MLLLLLPHPPAAQRRARWVAVGTAQTHRRAPAVCAAPLAASPLRVRQRSHWPAGRASCERGGTGNFKRARRASASSSACDHLSSSTLSAAAASGPRWRRPTRQVRRGGRDAAATRGPQPARAHPAPRPPPPPAEGRGGGRGAGSACTPRRHRSLPPRAGPSGAAAAPVAAAVGGGGFEGMRVQELMPLYYRRLFPHGEMYRWLAYGNGARQGAEGEGRGGAGRGLSCAPPARQLALFPLPTHIFNIPPPPLTPPLAPPRQQAPPGRSNLLSVPRVLLHPRGRHLCSLPVVQGARVAWQAPGGGCGGGVGGWVGGGGLG